MTQVCDAFTGQTGLGVFMCVVCWYIGHHWAQAAWFPSSLLEALLPFYQWPVMIMKWILAWCSISCLFETKGH